MHQVFPDTPTLLLAQIHRVNRTLRNLLCDSRNPAVPATEGYSFNITVHQVPVETFRSLFIVTFKWQKYWILCIFVRYWRIPALFCLFRRKCLFLISWCFDVLFCTTFPCILCLQNVFCTEWIEIINLCAIEHTFQNEWYITSTLFLMFYSTIQCTWSSIFRGIN